ncbi:MAG TPA: ABC transporter ATP-binding protein [Ktedonobacteraceae bacterium]|nr:ABC transporter ATP-binding protein [Ktedonobacteraceae bacterium]
MAINGTFQSNHEGSPYNRATSPLLEVKHLNVDYLAASGTVHAVTDVSFSLRRGEILGLAGESGSGKSTLAYAITRLLRPPALITGGEIRYYPREKGEALLSVDAISKDASGADVITMGAIEEDANNRLPAEIDGESINLLRLSPARLRKIRWNDLAIVFQSAMNALNPVMTIGAQITDVLRAHRPSMGPDSRKQRAIELLKLVGIAPDRLRSYPHELSGGMRQRAIIAIALALSPEILIMDEPTTALDVVVQREILTEIIRLREKLNFAVIFITHDLSLLLELADNVAIMYAGRIVEQASTRDMYLHPRHPYSYGLLNSFPALRGPLRRMSGIPGSPPDLRSVPPGCAFHPRCPFAFDACHKVLPVLQSVQAEDSSQMVACHLYNPVYSVEPPTASDLAKKYEALAEGNAKR